MRALIFTAFLLVYECASSAADLPTVSIEHLYYLQTRAQRLKEIKPDEMIDYCLALKIGGPAFDSLNAQVHWLRIEHTKLLKVDMLPITDPYIRWLNKALEAYSNLLRDEAVRIREGLLKEGAVATDTLEAIGRAQTPK
jgi:hypothetical protein